MFCCTGFQELLSSAGNRGLSILVWKSPGASLCFFLQSRGVAFGDEMALRPIPADVTVNISSEICVQYCPFCGCWLQDLTDRNRGFYMNIAQEHAKLLSSLPQQ